MGSISYFDIILVAIYMGILAFIGIYSSKKIKSKDSYFVAGRQLPTFVLIATVCATVMGGSALIGRGGYAYTGGVVSIAIGLPYMIGMFLFSIFSGRISRMGHKYGFMSMSEVLGYRFGKTVKVISALLVAYTSIATVGSQISATGTILSTVGGDKINYLLGAIIATIVFTAYTASSGLFGVVYTDVVQFVVLLVFVYIMLPVFTVGEVGGLSALIQQTSPDKWSWQFDSEIITLIVTNFVMTIAGAEFWQRAFAAKDPKSAFKGQFWGTAVYGVTIIITMFIGLSAAILVPNLIADYGSADYAVPVMIVEYLPKGMIGLALGGILSVMMSSSDSYLLLATQSITTDVVKTFKEDTDKKRELRITRISTILFALLAFTVAMFFTQAYDALMFGWTFYAATLGVPSLAAIIWKKATTPGVLSGMAVGFIISIVWKVMDNPFGVGSTIVGVALNALVLITVSLLTHKKYPSKTIDFAE